MTNLYVTSGEKSSGKSAICIGLGLRFQADGYKTGYMKPVNINTPLWEGVAFDEDVNFAKTVFEMPETREDIGPVALTPARFEAQLRGPETDFAPRLMEAYKIISQGRDILVLEGGRSLREGYVAGLPPRRVVELLGASVLLALRFDETLMVDRALAAQGYFFEALKGVVLNDVPRARLEYVHSVVGPYLSRHGVEVFGVIPRDTLLASPTVGELAEGLRAEILVGAESGESLVENMMVGAMSAEAALTHFRRKPNKAVITGGDRADLQMAALETSTRCLILTGNLYPNPMVLHRAEERDVPVLLTNLDTMNAVEVVEEFFGLSRFQQPHKIERFKALLEENFNFNRLYESIGIARG